MSDFHISDYNYCGKGWLHSFINSFIQQMLIELLWISTLLGSEDITVNKTDKDATVPFMLKAINLN